MPDSVKTIFILINHKEFNMIFWNVLTIIMFRIEAKDVSIYKTCKFYYEAIESGKIDLPLITERL